MVPAQVKHGKLADSSRLCLSLWLANKSNSSETAVRQGTPLPFASSNSDAPSSSDTRCYPRDCDRLPQDETADLPNSRLRFYVLFVSLCALR